MPLRSDLTLEAAEEFLQSAPSPKGISMKRYLRGSFQVSDCIISSPAASHKIGKPVGRYITMESGSTLDVISSNLPRDAHALAEELKGLCGRCERVLVVGLGNRAVTPDSLGPLAAGGVLATRHLDGNEGVGELFDCSVSVISPGVMGKTGLEALETVKAAAKITGAQVMILVDALACSGVSKLGCAVQLCDSGICPGSGVMNSRAEISKRTTGCKCIAIGVPTMADSKELGLMVTPKSIDRIIAHSAKLIAGGINLCLHPGLSLSETQILSE